MASIGADIHLRICESSEAIAYISLWIGLERRDLELKERFRFMVYQITTQVFKVMAKQLHTICVKMYLDFTYDDKRTSLDDASEIALDLALRPCFDSIVEGVKLDGIGVE